MKQLETIYLPDGSKFFVDRAEYERKVQELEAKGASRSDAQACADSYFINRELTADFSKGVSNV